jgi:hypothetical protein
MFKGYPPKELKPFELPNVSVVTAEMIHERVENGEIPAPFAKASNDNNSDDDDVDFF